MPVFPDPIKGLHVLAVAGGIELRQRFLLITRMQIDVRQIVFAPARRAPPDLVAKRILFMRLDDSPAGGRRLEKGQSVLIQQTGRI